MTWTLVTAAVLVIIAILAGALYRQWRLHQNFRSQLEAAAANLERLQQVCSRLAPEGAVQRLNADDVQPGTGPKAEPKSRLPCLSTLWVLPL